jgi:hypothetical protein
MRKSQRLKAYSLKDYKNRSKILDLTLLRRMLNSDVDFMQLTSLRKNVIENAKTIFFIDFFFR